MVWGIPRCWNSIDSAWVLIPLQSTSSWTHTAIETRSLHGVSTHASVQQQSSTNARCTMVYPPVRCYLCNIATSKCREWSSKAWNREGGGVIINIQVCERKNSWRYTNTIWRFSSNSAVNCRQHFFEKSNRIGRQDLAPFENRHISFSSYLFL